jgi:hypothetical protein
LFRSVRVQGGGDDDEDEEDEEEEEEEEDPDPRRPTTSSGAAYASEPHRAERSGEAVSMRRERPKSVSVISGLEGSVQAWGWSRGKEGVVRRIS